MRFVVTPSIDRNVYTFVDDIDFEDNWHQKASSRSTQFCSFIEKKNTRGGTRKGGENTEWMAYHPDDLFDTFRKLLHFIDFQTAENQSYLDKNSDQIRRLLFKQPLLMIKDDLYKIKVESGIARIEKVSYISYDF